MGRPDGFAVDSPYVRQAPSMLRRKAGCAILATGIPLSVNFRCCQNHLQVPQARELGVINSNTYCSSSHYFYSMSQYEHSKVTLFTSHHPALFFCLSQLFAPM